MIVWGVYMEEYYHIIFRTCFLYVFIIIVFRLMGKREVGELSVIDLVVFVLIAEVAAFALDDYKNLSLMPYYLSLFCSLFKY